MMLQFEITTRCNFDCFYCAGRAMAQGDMSFAAFTGLLERHIARHGTPAIVSLQGEGEPTLHHDFFRMAEHARAAGSTPYTITNGTYKHPEHFAGLFPRIGISIDTLDAKVASQIGRHNLPRVLEFVAAVAPHAVIVIHSVAHPVHAPPIARWCQEKGYQHIVQPLQQKPDYSRHYPKDAPVQVQVPAPRGRFSCTYLETPLMRYYTLDGLEMPCCFIKDGSAFEGMDAMLRHEKDGTWPRACLGCRYARDIVLSPQQSV